MMDFGSIRFSVRKYVEPIVLVLIWTLGVGLGISVYESFYIHEIVNVISCPVSVHGLLIVVFIPLLLAYFSILNGVHALLYSLVLLKAVAFCFTGCILSYHFGNSSWLIRLLLQFSDYFCIALLFYMVIKKNLINRLFFGCCGLLIAATDYFVISPFLQGLF